jgi:hypothetical protein
VLYSVIPPEVVFADWQSLHGQEVESLVMTSAALDPKRYREVVRGGARLIVCETGEGMAEVVRLISTDPSDYLNPEYMPGAGIKL